MKKFKYLLILFSFFISFESVYALQNLDRFSNLTIAEKGQIYNNTGNDVYNPVGYLIETLNYSNGTTSYFAQTTSNLITNYNGYGASISQCGLSFIANNYYAMSFYFLSDETYPVMYSPTFTQKTYKIGISNDLTGVTTFNYLEVDNGENVYHSDYSHVAYYTLVFEAPTNGTCITSAFSTSPSSSFYTDYNMFPYLGYTFEYLGSAPLTEDKIQNALSGSFNDLENSINSNIDELEQVQNATNDKLDEAHETSKGIWGSIKDGFSSVVSFLGDMAEWLISFPGELLEMFQNLGETIGGFFVDLFNDIKTLFVGEEVLVCETERNYFKDYSLLYSRFSSSYSSRPSMMDKDGWFTLSSNDNVRYTAEAIPDLKPSTEYTVIFEFKEAVNSPDLYFNYPYGSLNDTQFEKNTSGFFINTSSNLLKFLYFKTKADIENYLYAYSLNVSGTSTNPVTFRIMILEGHYTEETYDYEYFSTTREVCDDSGSTDGLFGIITGGINSIGKWFQNLLTGILDGLKSLFIPDDGYFTSYFDELYTFFTEKLGVLLFPIDLFLDLLDRFINLEDNSSGLIHIPSISLGNFGELISERDFYINEYWDDEPYHTLYNVYLVFVHAFIGFCLYKLADKKYREIVESGNSDS